MSEMVWNFSDMRSFNIPRRPSDEFQVDVKTIVCRVDIIIFERVFRNKMEKFMASAVIWSMK